MEIRDVIGNIRGDILALRQEVQSLRSYVDLLERFTWNIVKLMAEGTDIVVTLEDSKEEEDGDPTLF